MRHRVIARTALLVALLVGSSLAALPAQASFPGVDGRILIYSAKDGCCQLLSMAPDGTKVRQLTHLPPGTIAYFGSWSPDARHIVYSVGRAPAAQIWVMNADGSSKHRLLADPWFIDFFPTYSPDGRRIVFSRCQPDPDELRQCAIFRVNSDGTHLTKLTAFRLEVLDFAAKYSPDGRRIAFGSFGRGGVLGAVYIMNADGSGLRRLTPPQLGGFAPDWSPDGRKLVFTAHCCSPEHTSIWRINADGTGLVQLTSPGASYDFGPVYAPAGDLIAFERDSPDFSSFGVWVMRPDGTGAHQIRDSLSGPVSWASSR